MQERLRLSPSTPPRLTVPGDLYPPTLMQTQPEDTITPNAPQASGPSPQIDQAILDLLTRINGFSDDHFDTAFVTLDESELEPLVVLLLQHWTDNLEGRLLAGCLLVLREGGGFSTLSQPPFDRL